MSWLDPLGWNSAPSLPPSIIVSESGVTIEHYYGDEHLPAHAHVKGGGKGTRIGANGKPIKEDPELSR